MFTPANPAYPELIRAIFSQAPFIQHLGIELVDVGPGWCETSLHARPEHYQQDGFFHAGVQATLADHAAGAAAATLMPPGYIVLTVEYKINLLRPGVGQQLRGRAEVLRTGKTITVVEASVYAQNDGQEKLTAKAIVTLAFVKQG